MKPRLIKGSKCIVLWLQMLAVRFQGSKTKSARTRLMVRPITLSFKLTTQRLSKIFLTHIENMNQPRPKPSTTSRRTSQPPQALARPNSTLWSNIWTTNATLNRCSCPAPTRILKRKNRNLNFIDFKQKPSITLSGLLTKAFASSKRAKRNST